MSIFLVGDIHGFIEAIQRCNRFVEPDDIIIQVGDFGVSRSMTMEWNQLYPTVKCKTYFIDGNHENFTIVNSWPKDEVKEVAKNLFYIPRGMVLEMEGLRIGFLGGAESVDKAWRVLNGPAKSWWAEERITDEDVDRLVKNVGGKPLDVLIAHSPPNTTISARFPKLNVVFWGLPMGWVDVSAKKVTEAMVRTNPKRVFCGHMHKSITHDNVRILDINEVYLLSSSEDMSVRAKMEVASINF